METTWFCLVALMLTAYVVLDGFDLGAGILHLTLPRTDAERQVVLRTIGPVWDGNEVWLIAGGGTLYFAFPTLYASGFSGFYLPLHIVLWLLIWRGVGIEFRMHSASPVWRSLFDGLFAVSSLLLAVFFGAALANVLRGVPLQADGYFFEPLWTNWRVGPEPGILDWYTVICGVTALVALAVHGAAYLALKTSGDLNARAKRTALRLWPLLLALTAASSQPFCRQRSFSRPCWPARRRRSIPTCSSPPAARRETSPFTTPPQVSTRCRSVSSGGHSAC